MTTYSRQQDLDLLRRALRETTGDDELDEMVRGSLYANVARDPDKARVYREETAPLQAMADMHLGGQGVEGHLANASHFAKFISRVSEATKYTARSIAGVSAYSENLLIEGASPGSVRVVLRAPDGTTSAAHVSDEVIMDTPDSSALKKILGVLTWASDNADLPDSDDLLAAMHDLPPDARTSLKGAATQVIKAGWDVEGAVRQRRQEEERIHVTPRGAASVRSALKFNPGEAVRERHLGAFDGLKRSLGTVYFKAVEPRRGFAAAVAHEGLLDEVAALVTDPDREVVAYFDVRSDVGDDGSVGRRTRVLAAIELISKPDPSLVGWQGDFGADFGA